ncbi:hypothetical protein ACFL6U_32415 [Planctomycetota bacterium]
MDSLPAESIFVINDIYNNLGQSGPSKLGLPILYYRAHPDRTAHDCNNPDNPKNIYNYRDNHALLALGVPYDKKSGAPPLCRPQSVLSIDPQQRD